MTIPTRYFAQSSLDGALPTLYAATMPDVRGGAYLGPSKRFETVGPPTFVKSSGAAARRGRRAAAVGRLRAADRRLLRVGARAPRPA